MKRTTLVIVAAWAMCVWMTPAGAVGLPTPGGVTAQTVKLPDGPGSVRGLASDAAVNAFTGQVAYEVPIELPAGPGGFAPHLALSYSGGLGNGPLGIGWSLGQAGVRRSLRLGVPSYTDKDELELFGLAGPTLVPIGGGQYRAEGQGNAIRGTAVDGGFELIDGAGTHYRIGTSDASRVMSGTRVAAWYLERVTDVAGHVIDYSYARQSGELYLTAITWGGANAFRAELIYEARPDVVVSWRTGFRIAAERRLIAVKLWSFGGLRRTVELTYEQSFALSRLATVRVVGGDGTSLPTTTLSYAAPTSAQVQLLGNTGGWSLGTSTTSFFDVDKDGAMDLLRVEAGSHRYRRNLGGSFGPEVSIANAPALAMSSVRMLDLDGDSGAEMVTRAGTSWRSYRIVGNGWVATDWPGSATLDLPNVAVADLDGDNRMDVVTASGSGISVWLGTADGFAAPRTLPAISPGESSITPTSVQFHDLNGDGLADAVAVNASSLLEYRGRGDGTFERIGAVAYPWTGTTTPTQVRLADLNRDGLLDIVRVGTSQVFWYRGRPDGTFSTQPMVLNRPPGADASTVVALADVNGNGSTDVVWSSPSGMWALDLAGPTSAGLLVGINNGLGKVQQFDYTASTQLAWAAEAASAPWIERMPVSIAVATTMMQTLASGDPDRTTQLAVRDGIYEAAERRFLGFAQSIEVFPGADAASTIRVVTQYHAGRGADRVLRGEPLVVRTEDGTGNVFKLVEHQVSALAVDGLPLDPRLARAAVRQTQTTFTELGEAPAVVRTRFAFDGEGRQIEERRDGRVVPGVALDGDESIIRRSYTDEDATTRVRDLVCDETVLDGAEEVVSHTQRRFGDASPAIAGPCRSANGWVREELGFLASEARWVSLKRTSYDADGNPVVVFADGVERTLGYDGNALHPVSESVSPTPGQTLRWTAQWDSVAGTLSQVGAPDGTTSTMTYDGVGRLLSTARGVGTTALAHTFYRYSWIAPRPTTEIFTFDGDPAGLGPLPATWTPGAGWRHTVVVATSAGEQLLTAVQLDATQWNVGEYRQRDARGRVIAIASPFDFTGVDVTTVALPVDAVRQTLAYDPLDRVVDQALPTGSHKRATYHPLGVTLAIDGLAPVGTRLDGQDRTIHTERTVNGVVESVDATYDAAGRILQFRLQGGQVHHDFTYDSLGRLTHATDQDVGPRDLQYDDAGRVVRSTNGAGDVVDYGYDGAGRLTTVDGTGVTTRFHYDAARSAGFDHTGGQLAWVEEPTGTVDLSYDNHGRLAIQQRTIAAAVPVVGREATQFAPSGLPRSVDLGDGVVLPIRHDAGGRVSGIDGLWAVEQYNGASMPTRELYGNGVVQRYERDIANRPTQVTVAKAAAPLYGVAASYHEFGAIASLTDTDHTGVDHTATFGFDGAGRLTAATMGAYRFSYAYDGLQNMVRRDATGPTQLDILAGTYQYQPAAPRRLAQIVSAGGDPIASFAYDGAGRQTQHAGKMLTYDALSRVVRIDGVAGGHVEHRYGYDGSRVATRDAAGNTTYWITPNIVVRGSARDHYVHVGDRLLARITTTTAPSGPSAASKVAAVIRGPALLAALVLCWLVGLGAMVRRALRSLAGRRELRPLRALRSALAASLGLVTLAGGCGTGATTSGAAAALTGPATLYFHQSYGAGPELTTDDAGALVEDRRTEPFGAAIDAFRGGAVQTVDYASNPINALNKLTDPDTGWSFHGARWLAPDTAQWHSPDPPATAPDTKFMAKPWGLHPYQYVEQNPITFWDPDGRETAVIDWRATFDLARSLASEGPHGRAAGGLIIIGAAAVTVGVVAGDKIGAAAGKVWDFVTEEPWFVKELKKHSTSRTTDAAPSPNDQRRDKNKDRSFVVRLQAQGGGLEESVVLAGSAPISVAQGLAGLATLRAKLTDREVEERSENFARAARFIGGAPAGGGVGPPGKSFSTRGSDIRVDVEVLKGVNFSY